MDTQSIIILLLIVGVVALTATAIVVYMRYEQTRALKKRFGPEYARTVEESRSQSKAEARLERRKERVSHYPIRALSAEEQTRFRGAWREVQADFVDDPRSALTEADHLLGEVMSAKGYPVSDFEQQSADLSVDHPVVVQEYRAAHAVALRRDQGEVETEDLRRAMKHYRALFDELANDNRAAAAS
jgi:hypothetical protein